MLSALLLAAACAASPAAKASVQTNTIEIVVSVQVPDSAWQVRIEAVYRGEDAYVVVSRLSRPSGLLGAQVISTCTDRLQLVGPALPVRHVILGRSWSWRGPERDVVFTDDTRLADWVGERLCVWRLGAPAEGGGGHVAPDR